jgi:acyl dehydratase
VELPCGALNPSELSDRSFGPHSFRVGIENVLDFVATTGDDEERWIGAAPPGFMARAMFVVASDLLRQLADRAVIHGEQTFVWHRPLEIEAALVVSGLVSRVRERGGVDFVDFDVRVHDGAERLVAEASSLFLVSAVGAGARSEERAEPAPEDNGSPGPGRVAASRADLVRYAAATRDWNPIHWDHDTAVAAGLPGVISHGLLQAAWVLAAAAELRPGDSPLRSARVRFRNPLLPATPVTVTVEETDDQALAVVQDGDVQYVSARIELADR